jgi:hypothetical protein
VRSWWWPATLLLAAGTAVLTTLGKVPTLPGWIAAGIAMIAGLATATMSDVVRARLRWLVERGPTAAALRNGFLLTSRGRIPRVEDVGALALGVYRAMRVNEEKTAELPPYVKRDLDIELDDLLRLGGLVVIEGKSAAARHVRQSKRCGGCLPVASCWFHGMERLCERSSAQACD